MKYILLLFLMTCASFIYGQDRAYDYCYVNNKGICVYSVADKAEQVIVKKGLAPCISPDGKKVAYVTYVSAGETDPTIAVIDLNTRKRVLFDRGSNDPVWSPDGKLIAYKIFNEQKGKWVIAVTDFNNTVSPNILTEKVEESDSPSWQAGSKNVVVQDMNKLYVLDLSGNVMTTYKISDIAQTGSPSSDDMFVFTPDNKKIVFSIHMTDEPEVIEGSPPSAIFVYDIDSRSTLRLSPKGYSAYGLVIKNNKVLFTATKSFQSESPVYDVYTVDMDGKNLKVLFKKCSDISAKN